MRIISSIRSWQVERREKGMAMILYLGLFTIIAGYLGYAMDSALGNYTANGLKNAVDNATLIASGKTKSIAGGKQAINATAAKTTFTSYYGQYRQAYPNVTVRGKYTLSTFKVTSSRSGTQNTLTVQIREKSNTRFLAILGTPEFVYNIKSTARLGSLYENK